MAVSRNNKTRRSGTTGPDQREDAGGLMAQLQDQFQELTARKEKMITTVHDLKIPLTVSLLNLELAEMEDDPRETLYYMSLVRRELEFMLETIGSMLELEKADENGMEIKTEKLNLKTIIDGVIERMQVLLKDKPELTLVCDVSDKIPEIMGDPHKLTRVFNNLYANAINYTDKGTITACAIPAADTRSLSIQLSDTGKGISQDKLTKLFQLFEGDDLSAASSGVGLVYVKKVMESHRGKVLLESELNAGTTVTVEFPVED
jgi:signal transduction histidine kinase